MTIHVTIDEAGVQLAELVAAALRGEEVILAQAGEPQVRLTPVSDRMAQERDAITASRLSALGMYADRLDQPVPLVRDLKPTDAEWEEHYRRKFRPAD